MKMRVLVVVLTTLCLAFFCAGDAQSAVSTVKIVEGSCSNSTIVVVGKGYAPVRKFSDTQRKLLAKRAAVLDAYRNLSAKLSGMSSRVQNGTGCFNTSGYIKGAEIRKVRYYCNGMVEVELVMPIVFNGN